jgi:hypothetical protein
MAGLRSHRPSHQRLHLVVDQSAAEILRQKAHHTLSDSNRIGAAVLNHKQNRIAADETDSQFIESK